MFVLDVPRMFCLSFALEGVFGTGPDSRQECDSSNFIACNISKSEIPPRSLAALLLLPVGWDHHAKRFLTSTIYGHGCLLDHSGVGMVSRSS